MKLIKFYRHTEQKERNRLQRYTHNAATDFKQEGAKSNKKNM